MKVYIIHPLLTIGDFPDVTLFAEECFHELDRYVDVSMLTNEDKLRTIAPGKSDMIVFFNYLENQEESYLLNQLFDQISELKSRQELKEDIIPVGSSVNSRKPPDVFKEVQSFDIVDHLRRRKLSSEYIPTIAVSLARTIISKLQPTLYKEKMKFFLSHRRADGENIAASFCRELRGRGETPFRDLLDILVGEEAQHIIEENVRQSDAVIFLDTPLAGESEWINKELLLAMSLNIPIVWVQVGSQSPEDRKDLKIKPGSKPHFELPKLSEAQPEFELDLLDKIIDQAFRMSRESAKLVYDQIQRLRQFQKHGVEVRELNKRNLFYRVTVKRSGFKYLQNPMTHLIQFYGRAPKLHDITSVNQAINEMGYTNSNLGKYHDTTLILTPRTASYVDVDPEEITIEPSDEYLYEMERIVNPSKVATLRNKGIVLAGAFPDSELEYHQILTDAVFALVTGILNKEGTIIFGAHPTFQHLIFQKAKELFPDKYKEHVHMYVSEYWLNHPLKEEYKKHCTLFPTEINNNNLDLSLTELRQQMIQNEKAIALIALGGKTDSNGHKPGIDEEIELARKKGIPVFILGAVGGRSAQLAAAHLKSGTYRSLNTLSEEDNKLLMMGTDFSTIFDKIVSSLII
ncbi:TIR domain-containing protein [Paenibacillus sp. WQ 127069]|uniref:TIR domain-containing protein n=1 Tax=Paenibacillus baimaensis TaxID=2982185 RepID=A0ABT2UFC1_9BACL|nr:TIR domain-containing protein [Paenibacillus sp. WQ 127069]MCU6793333.1 TIR domain-containing protein [Paenibacillus sp. WQ 127069]